MGKIRRSEDRKNKRVLCFNRQKGLCYYCFKQLQIDKCEDDDYATLEHLIPRVDGGSWEIKNLSVACAVCNNSLGKAYELIDKSMSNIVLKKFGRNKKTAKVIDDMDYRIKIFVLRNFIKKGYTTKDKLYFS